MQTSTHRNARYGEYAERIGGRDIQGQQPNQFEVGKPRATDWQTKWQVALAGRVPPGSGAVLPGGGGSVTFFRKKPGRGSRPGEAPPDGDAGAQPRRTAWTPPQLFRTR